MADVVDKKSRSRMMSGIRGKDTRPELAVRKALHALGFRYRLQGSGIPGKPDLVFPKHAALVQVQGCFWHGHNCHLFKMPSTRTEFWREKIHSNMARDKKNLAACRQLGWKTLVVWECAIKGKTRLPPEELGAVMQSWLLYDNQDAEITGRAKGKALH
jgi:DNA mismatch endonuclease (patch repair protein)